MLVPKLFTTLQTYNFRKLNSDVAAGVIVGIVALPLSIAFAIASGVSPERGLWTAIVAGFLISALGGSRVQIGGPTGAFVVIIYGIVHQHGIEGLLVAGMMAGVILIGLGVTGLGNAIKFVPHPVVIGFTSGIALIIFSSQVNDLLGLRMSSVPAGFVEKWAAYSSHLGAIDPVTVAVAALTLAIIILWPRTGSRIPGPFVALVAMTALVHFAHLRVETISDRFGVIASSFPVPHLPHVAPGMIRALFPSALTIALLAGIESLLSAVVADSMIGGRHRSNMELVAQGVANIISPMMGGMPATGAIARTATNVRNGGRTPVAGIVHAFTLLLITLFFGKLAGLVPFPTLAAILVVVSYHMSEWRGFRSEFTAPRSDTIVMLVTFTLTVLVDLTVAIQVGMVLAAFLFMKRMAEVSNIDVISAELRDDETDAEADARTAANRDVQVFEINGPFFFGAAQLFKERVQSTEQDPRYLLLRMRHVPVMDSTGLHALREVIRRTRSQHKRVLVCDVQPQPLAAMTRARLLDDLGEDSVFATYADALDYVRVNAE